MKANQFALSVLIASAVGSTTFSSAFVPISFRPKQSEQLKTTRTTSVRLSDFNSNDGYFWKVPGKPANHPDNWNPHIIELGVQGEEEYYEYDEQEAQAELSQSSVPPLPEVAGTEESAYQESVEEEPAEQEERTPLPHIEGDARLNALLEEAEFLAEEVRMLREEEEALFRSDGTELDEGRSRASLPLITDPESILADKENGLSPFDAESGPRAMDSPEDSEEEKMRQSGEEAAKRFREEAARMKDEEFEAREEMRRRGILEAQRQKAEMARIRAQQEEERIKAEIEARIAAIEAAARMREEGMQGSEDLEDRFWARDRAPQNTFLEPQRLEPGEANFDAAEGDNEANPFDEIRAAEEARLEYVERMRAEANAKREEQERARIDARTRAEEEAKRVLAETARIRAEREEAGIKAKAEARQQAIEAAQRLKEETARRAEERNAQLWAQEEARLQARDDAIRRVEERERMMEEESRMMREEEEKWLNRHGDEDGRPNAGDGSDDSKGRDQPPSVSDVMKIIG